MKKLLIILIVVVVLGFIWIGLLYWQSQTPEQIINNSNQNNSNAAPPVNKNYDDIIRVTTPKSNELITSPLKVSGEARGTWYFEASFPVRIEDADGHVLVQQPMQATADWMTENFVPFEGMLNFQTPSTSDGFLILEKDNPSGLQQNADELRIPIKFDISKQTGAGLGNCKITGCSGQICSDKDMVTTCEYTAAYACYKKAICEHQPNGSCGWTQTLDLIECLQNATTTSS